jgi:hypothetical protein
MEDGGLLELVDAFIEITKGFVIPAGTVLLVSSASRLASIGTEGYAAEYDMALHKLKRVMGEGVTMLHGLFFLSSGSKDVALMRSILDIEHWLGCMQVGRDITSVRKHCIRLIFGEKIEYFSAGGSGSPRAPLYSRSGATGPPGAPVLPSTRLMLPVLGNFGKKTCFESPEYANVPRELHALSENDERNLVEMLAETLNNSFMTDLAVEICTSRDNGTMYEESMDSSLLGKRFVVVGASHATRLACVMEDLGAVVIDLSVPGWRPTADNVASAIRELNAVLAEDYSGETIVIYQLYDNSCYLACSPAGETSLPVKLADNKFHVEGRLTFVDRTGFRELFTATLPLLRAGKDCVKILLSPLMRYALEPCCADNTHMTNRSDSNFGSNLGQALSNIGEWLQDLAFTRRIRNFAVMCPTQVMQQAEGERRGSFWTEGPVHMNGEGYRFLGAALLERFADVKLSRKVEKKTTSEGNRSRIDHAATRQAWVAGNDSAVKRRYDVQEVTAGGGRGRGNGDNYGGRGRGGSRSWRGRGFGKNKHFRNFPY